MKLLKVFGDYKAGNADGLEINTPFFMGYDGEEIIVLSSDLKVRMNSINAVIWILSDKGKAVGRSPFNKEYSIMRCSAKDDDFVEITRDENGNCKFQNLQYAVDEVNKMTEKSQSPKL